MKTPIIAADLTKDYSSRLQKILAISDWGGVEKLCEDLLECWRKNSRVFICGNGGSAANAVHLANDFIYGVARKTGQGLRVEALSANTAVMTCLANDVGYEHIFSEQLAVQSDKNDLLIALSGSGNSPNIIHALEMAKERGIKSFAILGYSGGKAKEIADVSIHFPVNDMQIAEDMQLIVGHMVMQFLYSNRNI